MFYIFSQDIADTYPHISIPQSSFICQDYLDFHDSALKIYAHVRSVTIMSHCMPLVTNSDALFNPYKH